LQASSKQHAGLALYKQAYACFNTRDYQASADAAAQALAAGYQTAEARFLYGDAVFRGGDAERAKSIYLSIRSQSKESATRATATRKIAAVNKDLGLPPASGIKD
jgi:TolA-binding protein